MICGIYLLYEGFNVPKKHLQKEGAQALELRSSSLSRVQSEGKSDAQLPQGYDRESDWG